MGEVGQGWTARVQQAGALAARLSMVHAELVDFTAGLLEESRWSGPGVRSPEHWLQVYTGLSLPQARAIVHLAERRADLPVTVGMLAQGRLSLCQAAVVAKHVPASAEAEVARLGETLSVAQLSRLASQYPFEREARRHEEPRTPPAERGSELSMRTRDGRFLLRFEADAVEGALIEQAVREAKDALFTAGNAQASLADGLVEVASRSLGAVSSPARREHYRVLLHVDTDGRTWMHKKGAVPAAVAGRLTCDASLRVQYETDGVPVSVGRSQRIVPERTRRLVESRDQGCRFPGCRATGFVEVHHIVPWSEGGSTDYDQLVSLCAFHHREHHRGQFTIEGRPSRPDGLVFLGRGGHRIGKHLPATPIARSEMQITSRPPALSGAHRGERLDYGSVHFGSPAADFGDAIPPVMR